MNSTRIQFPAIPLPKKFLVVWAIGFATFGAFMLTTLLWGGAALNGKIENRRYYLGEHGEFREIGRGYYAISAALSAAWPPMLVIAVSQVRSVFPPTPANKKLFLVLTMFFTFGATAFSITSLICLVRAFG